MHGESPNELFWGKSLSGFLTVLFIVFEWERNCSILLVNIENTVIANRYFMGVPAQILNYDNIKT